MTLKGYKPELCWTGSDFESNCILWVEDGRVQGISRDADAETTANVQILNGQAILPGMINAHSHAWHRGLRDVPEGEPAQAGNNFWGWRETMYQLASQLANDPQKLGVVCRAAFDEMIGSGITTVGEFHYLHHSRSRATRPGSSNEDTAFDIYDLDSVILDAAQRSGIRIVLLETFYEMAGLDPESQMNETQKCFLTASQNEFWDNWNRLRQKHDGPRAHFGVAAHSIRALTLPNLVATWTKAVELDIPFHIHLEEQPKEIEDSLKHYKMSPSQLLLQNLPSIDCHFTGVHCTHTAPEHIGNFRKQGANVCITPLTEGRLGDGTFGGAPDWCSPNDSLFCCLGSDCNNRICFAEEMRWAVYLQQVNSLKRGLPGCRPQESSRQAFRMATLNGARSLGLDKFGGAGSLEPGNFADFFTIDLNHASLKTCAKGNLLDAFVFGTSSDTVVRAVWVNGELVHTAKLEIEKPLKMPADQDGSATIASLDSSSVAAFDASLMAISSISGDERQVGLALEQWCAQQGWHTHRQFVDENNRNFNLLVTVQPWKQGDPGPRLLLNSHMDTVPPFIPPTFQQDRTVLRGRGSADAKGQICAMTFAARSLNANLRSEVGFLWVTQEETTHLGAKVANSLDLRPEFVICGEPTELKLARAQKGILKVKVQVTGRAGHSGYPELYESATEKLLDFLTRVRQFDWPTNEQLGATTVNIGLIEGGVAANVIPGSASSLIMFRCVSDPGAIMSTLNSMAVDGVELQVVTMNSPFLLSTLDSFEEEVVCFNTDLPYFQFKSKPKCYLFGPGSIKICHSPDELINVNELERGVEMLAQMMEIMLTERK